MSNSSSQASFRALTSFLLVSLFLFAPLAPLAAEEAAAPMPASETARVEPASPASNSVADIQNARVTSPAKEPSDNPLPEVQKPVVLADLNKDNISADTASENVLDETARAPKIIEEPAKADSSLRKKPGGDSESASLALSGASQGAIFTPDNTVPQKTSLAVKPDQATGALTYAYPIYAPPGRLGMTPSLALKYNSQNQDNSSIVGYGWSLNIPYIQRQNVNGTNQLYSSFDFISSLSGELTPTSSTTNSTIAFGAKVENGDFLSYSFDSAGNKWTVTDKTGQIYTFGLNASERQDDPASSSRVFKWFISSIIDTNGNSIQYGYYKDAGQIYPQTITYTNSGSQAGIYSIEFARAARPDNLISFASAFRAQTNYLISQIQTKSSGTAIRTYVLAYTAGNNGLRSLLASMTETGYDPDSNSTVTLPATVFNYGPVVISPVGSWSVPLFLDNVSTRVGDVNGDGRVDIILSYYKWDIGDIKKVFINNGSGWTPDANWTVPVVFYTLYGQSSVVSAAEFIDINGDGKDDIMECFGFSGTPRVYINNGRGWDYNPTAWTGPCLHPNNNGGVSASFADLNGDGLVDYQSGATLVANMGVGWNSVASMNTSTTPLTLTDSSGYDTGTRLFDINGDGLADSVRYQTYDTAQGQPARRSTYLNKGNGSWEAAPNLLSPQVFSDYKSSVPPIVTSSTNPVFDSDGDGLVNYTDANLSGLYGTDGTGKLFWNLGDVNADGLLDYIATNCISPAGCGVASPPCERKSERKRCQVLFL